MNTTESPTLSADRPPVPAPELSAPPWRILIVDEDSDVHLATELPLQHTEIQGRPLSFLNAFSAEEACQIMAREQDIAVVLLDVDMEQDSSGMDLARYIRDELGIADTRIILRTSQPKQAPGIEAIRDYDINDYKNKSELTLSKLYATLGAAIRSYEQLQAMESNRRGLARIVQGSSQLMGAQSLRGFSERVLDQLVAVLGEIRGGMICMAPCGEPAGRGALDVVCASGIYGPETGRSVSQLNDTVAAETIKRAVISKRDQYADQSAALYLGSESRGDMVAYVVMARAVNRVGRNLLEVFGNNVKVCADNLALMTRMHDAAYVDSLLNLPNRLAFLEAVGMALDDDRRQSHAVVLLDIDNFAEINDALGQRHGDLLLKAVAHRLRRLFSDEGIIARIAGDTFGLLIPLTRTRPEALLEPFKDFFNLEGVDQRITMTAGVVALSEVDGNRGSDAIKDASIMLKRAKQDQRGEVAYFERAMVTEARERLLLLQSLRAALDAEQLFLVYQPQINIASGAIVGLEALLRWRNTAGELIPPDRFIPLAEQSGLIVRIGEWVLRTAAARINHYRERGWHDLRVAVNVSVVQLRQHDFIDILKRVLEECAVPPHLLEIEVTESVAMGDFGANQQILQQIRDLGVELAIDDFGTGYSSLGYLQRMPVTRLKIDRSFIRNLHTTEGTGIVRMVIQLGHTLGLCVLAEGVEDEVSVRRLRELGCHEVQGYFYAKPMPDDQLEAWLGPRAQG